MGDAALNNLAGRSQDDSEPIRLHAAAGRPRGAEQIALVIAIGPTGWTRHSPLMARNRCTAPVEDHGGQDRDGPD